MSGGAGGSFVNQWTRVSTTGAFPARAGVALGEMLDGGLVAVGGFSSSAALSDVWRLTLQGTTGTWVQALTSGTAPPPRSGAAVAFDSTRRQVVIVGGFGSSDLIDDTWVLDLDSLSWSGPFPGAGKRGNSTLAFDAARNVMMLFGGRNCGTPCNYVEANDVLEFNGSSWRTLTTSGTAPSPREGAVGVVRDNTLFIFGGAEALSANPVIGLADGWALQGLNGTPTWQRLSGGTYSPGRLQASLVFDPVRNISLQFGGFASYTSTTTSFDATTWVFNHGTLSWTAGVGGQAPLRSPSARGQATGLWSRALNAVVVVGGITAVTNNGTTNVVSDEVWVYGR